MSEFSHSLIKYYQYNQVSFIDGTIKIVNKFFTSQISKLIVKHA